MRYTYGGKCLRCTMMMYEYIADIHVYRRMMWVCDISIQEKLDVCDIRIHENVLGVR